MLDALNSFMNFINEPVPDVQVKDNWLRCSQDAAHTKAEVRNDRIRTI